MAANAVIPHEFRGRRALVAGASKGIGQAVATRLREGGATVLATARTRPSDFVHTDLFVAADITTANGCDQPDIEFRRRF